MMNLNENYASPQVEVVEVEVEKGFAASCSTEDIYNTNESF